MTAEPLPPEHPAPNGPGRWQAGSRPSGADGAGARALPDVAAVAVAEPVLPARWPSAWPSLRGRFLRRLAFVVLVDVLTAAGLIVIGGFHTQWWALLPALVLLTGPALAPGRARRRVLRAADAGRLVVDPDGLVSARSGRPLARLDPAGTVHYLR